MESELNRKIDGRIKEYLKGGAFTDRKVTDMPKDANSVTPRKYITRNGASTVRPTSSVLGEFFYDTSLAGGNGQPIWWSGNAWRDADGNVV